MTASKFTTFEQGTEPNWSHLFQVLASANGYTTWSRQWNITGASDDDEYLFKLRNRGSGGKHLQIQKSTDASTVLQVTDTGLSTPQQITSTLATGTAPLVVASTTLVSNLNVGLLGGQAGSYYLSRTNHTGTQAPSTISPQGSGSGLDADTVDGSHASAFSASGHDHDSAYVNVTGDTMTDVLQVRANSSDISVKLQNRSGDGVVNLGASHSATPDLVMRNNAGTLVGTVTNNGLLMSGSQTAVVGAAGDKDVQVDQVWMTDGTNVRYMGTNGDAFQISNNHASGGTPSGVHLNIDTSGLVTVQDLGVDNDVEIHDDLIVHGDAVWYSYSGSGLTYGATSSGYLMHKLDDGTSIKVPFEL